MDEGDLIHVINTIINEARGAGNLLGLVYHFLGCLCLLVWMSEAMLDLHTVSH